MAFYWPYIKYYGNKHLHIRELDVHLHYDPRPTSSAIIKSVNCYLDRFVGQKMFLLRALWLLFDSKKQQGTRDTRCLCPRQCDLFNSMTMTGITIVYRGSPGRVELSTNESVATKTTAYKRWSCRMFFQPNWTLDRPTHWHRSAFSINIPPKMASPN